MHAVTTVYNTKRSGTFELGGRRFVLRRIAFPEKPGPEWYVVDLLEHADQAGASRTDLTRTLARAVSRKTFDDRRLRAMGAQYGSKATQALLDGYG